LFLDFNITSCVYVTLYIELNHGVEMQMAIVLEKMTIAPTPMKKGLFCGS
jgi:hypothetical protein